MRLIDETTRRALEGSRPADTLTVWAWRDGQLVLDEALELIEASASDTAGDSQKVNQQMGFTVADPKGVLGAWRFDDALGVGGTQLQVIYRVGGAGAVNFGKFRITRNEPDEVTEWRKVNEYGLDVPDSAEGPHVRMKPTTKGVVRLEAADLTLNVDRDKLEAPESPLGGATAINEVKRLTAHHFPTVVEPGVGDIVVAPTTVYDRERLDAVQDLLYRVNARHRMGGDGELRVYPRVTAPVWRTEPGNCMVSVSRKQALDGLYNRWVVTGKDPGEGGTPVRAVASLDTGPLRYDGPHGRAPYFYTSDMIETYGQALAYAIQLRDEFLSSLAVELTLSTTPRPELQAGDWIEVGCPVSDHGGYVAYFPGHITSIRRTWNPLPGPTSITVSCTYADIVAALGRTEWAQYITAGTPELIWDRMPATWGTLPAITWDELP